MEVLQDALIAFVGIFVIVNPVGTVPLFLAMTANDDLLRRQATSRIAAITVLIVLVGAALLGQTILSFFGVGVPALRIAGGVILFLIGLDMLNVRTTRTKTTDEEVQQGVAKAEVGIIPLGCPMLAGPGSIATVMLMRSHIAHDVGGLSALLIACLLVALATWMILRLSLKAGPWLTPSVLGIISRLEGLLLCAIAAEMVVRGLNETMSIGVRIQPT